MNKLIIAVACGAIFVQNAVFGQAAQDPQLQANASSAAVQAKLDQPDGVAITIKPDGTFQIFSRGSAVYDFNNPRAIQTARKNATMRAKANLAKFLKEKVSTKEGLDSVTKNATAMSSDGAAQTSSASMESVEVATESIRNSAEAILTGVITLKDQQVPSGNGGEVQVTIGMSSKTQMAAQKAAQGINQSLQNREAAPSTGAGASIPARPNEAQTRMADTDF